MALDRQQAPSGLCLAQLPRYGKSLVRLDVDNSSRHELATSAANRGIVEEEEKFVDEMFALLEERGFSFQGAEDELQGSGHGGKAPPAFIPTVILQPSEACCEKRQAMLQTSDSFHARRRPEQTTCCSALAWKIEWFGFFGK